MGCCQSIRPSPSWRVENGHTPPRRSTKKRDVRKGGGVGGERRKRSSERVVDQVVNMNEEDEVVDGWPNWLIDNIPRDVLKDIVPKSADSYIKIDKIGQGTYSNVYKARERESGKIVALKKVRFDKSEPESVKFMAREIMTLQKLDHPNIVKLQGLATSRMHYSLYLVFDYMCSDLSRIMSDHTLTQPQIKCYMQQLLSGLQHCHDRGILHRDIKGSNLLIDRTGMLKIADFGLANFFDLEKTRPLTSRVVTLWYRAPELLLGSTDYGIGIDLWSAGCLMAEMFLGTPILPGRSEVEQLHKIFKLCGTPSEEFYKRMKVSTALKPPQTYKSSLGETLANFPSSSLGLLTTLFALDPAHRGSAASALQDEFFHTTPLACDIAGLPAIHVEEDEGIATSQTRRRKSSRGRRRRERRHKSSEKVVMYESSTSSTTTTTTTSASSAAPKASDDTPPRLLASPSSEAHPNATRNININHNMDDDAINGFGRLGQKSASSREFRSLKNKSLLQ